MGWIDTARTRLAKTILGRPQGIADAQAQQGMNNTAALGPGTPLVPAEGYSQTPRRMDYPVGVNLNQSGRQAWGRTSFETLDALIDAYSPARSAMNHKIDELKSMELLFNPVDGFAGDAEDAIAAARLVLARPDRVLPYEEWLSLFMEGMLRYDAGVPFKRRNMAGEVIALEIIDGSTVFPFIDEFGRRPLPPAPAYFQRIHGQVWNEFTTDNIEYLRFRPQLKSPFGLAPMESVLLSVNTDLRQQWNLLQMFTEGSVPAGFMTLPPDISSPQQVQQWQEYWDSFVLGDQSMLHKMIVIPNGSEFKNTTPQKFDPTFPEYLERLTYAAFQVVPQDLGATADVNRATGETQSDIQFRVNTLPWVRFIEGMLNRYLKFDIGLPVQVNLNTGRDTEDSLAEVQRWAALIANGMASPDEGRAELTGLPIDNEHPVPRGFFSTKSGWQPLVNVYAAAGPTDPETAAPIWGAQPLAIAAPVPGLLDPLPVQAVAIPDTVQKDATAGVTIDTGIEGVDLIHDDDELVQKELAQFRTFKRGRINKGSWRDFTFASVDKVTAHNLNVSGLSAIRKADGEVVAAGLLVVADDSGRVLMIQRGLDDDAAGTFEAPGGHLESDESPIQAAVREWTEETGLSLPAGVWTGGWDGSNGLYEGFVYTIPSESLLALDQRNPEADPDGDTFEALAWFTPVQLFDNPTVRQELATDLPLVFAALNTPEVVDADFLADAALIAKAAAGTWRNRGTGEPQSQFDLQLTDYYAPLMQKVIADAVKAVPVDSLVAGLSKDTADQVKGTVSVNLDGLAPILEQLYADAYPTGTHSAQVQLDAKGVTPIVKADTPNPLSSLSSLGDKDYWDNWTPGNPPAAAKIAGTGLQSLLDNAGIQIKGITDSVSQQIGNSLADGISQGLSPAQMGRNLASMTDDPNSMLGRARSDIIANTESTRAITQGSVDQYQANGVGMWNLVTADDPDEECADIAAGGPYSFDDTDDQPPVHPYCLPGSARIVMPADVSERFAFDVASAGRFGDVGLASATAVAKAVGYGSWRGLGAVTERDFVGDFVTVVTELGNELTITPNHPVATTRGWVDAGELTESDYVLSRVRSDLVSEGGPDVENVEATIEQVANALPVRFAGMPVAAEDFHGDVTDGDVYVIRAARKLRNEVDSSISETLPQGEFVGADRVLAGLVSGSHSGLSFETVGAPTHSLVSSIGEGDTILSTGLGHANEHGLTAVAGFDSTFQQTATYGVPVDSEEFSESLLASSSEVTADKIVSVKRFSGHALVYNCMTTHGWFIADGIVVHNCRCAMSPDVDSIDAANIQTVDASDLDGAEAETGEDVTEGEGSVASVAETTPGSGVAASGARAVESDDLPTVGPLNPTVIKTKADLKAFSSQMPDPTTLDPKAEQLLTGYERGTAYDTNAFLRGQKVGFNGSTLDARSKAYAKSFAKTIDGVMDQSLTPEDVQVVRSVGADAFGGEDQIQNLVGQVMQDKGYLSTSLAEKTSADLYQAGKNAVSLTINVPKGTRALNLANSSYLANEKELLIDRGSSLAIQSATYDEGTGSWQVVATLVQGPRP